MADETAEVQAQPAPPPAPVVPPADDLAALTERVKRLEAFIAHFLPSSF